FRNTEEGNITGFNHVITNNVSKATSRLSGEKRSNTKTLKLLKQREAEIKNGNITNSLYADVKVNGIPIQNFKDLGSVRNAISNAITELSNTSLALHEYALIGDEIHESNFKQGLLEAAIRVKENYHNGLTPWNRANYMQFSLHYEAHKDRFSAPYVLPPSVDIAFSKFASKLDIASPDYMEDYAKGRIDPKTSPFHSNHWEIILYEKYNGGHWNIIKAKADHQKLKQELIDKLLRETPIGANSSVDYLVQALNISNLHEYNFLNDNPELAEQFRLDLEFAAQQDGLGEFGNNPNDDDINLTGGNMYASTKRIIESIIADGATSARVIEWLMIQDTYQKQWVYDNIKRVKEFTQAALGSNGIARQGIENQFKAEIRAGAPIAKLISDLKIENTEQKKWLYENEDKANEFKNFIGNDYSQLAQNWVAGQVELEQLGSNIPWKAGTGFIEGEKSLKYTHFHHDLSKGISYFKLTNGSIVAASSFEKTLTKSGQLTNKYRTTMGFVANERYFYIKLIDTQWSELLITKEKTAENLEKLFASGAEDLGKAIGMYALPIEDITIVLYGKDLNGNQVSRLEGAGYLALSIIPGSKGIKVFRKIIKFIKPLLKIMKKGYAVKIVNGVLQLRDKAGNVIARGVDEVKLLVESISEGILGVIKDVAGKIEYKNFSGNILKWSTQHPNSIKQSIASALKSKDAGKFIEGKVGEALQKAGVEIKAFGLKIKDVATSNVVGDIDIETSKYIIEVKKTFKSLKEGQLDKYINSYLDNYLNPFQKQTILYIDEALSAADKAKVLSQIPNEVILINSLEELLKIIK
ncbi:hypothetical protein, partial [Tenacibaculum agarivorans]|uniref:hypothetical protein n=1 Tax=Tenacibaculum agarivorans TaxID=1908389 RepID=UPI000B2FF445